MLPLSFGILAETVSNPETVSTHCSQTGKILGDKTVIIVML